MAKRGGSSEKSGEKKSDEQKSEKIKDKKKAKAAKRASSSGSKSKQSTKKKPAKKKSDQLAALTEQASGLPPVGNQPGSAFLGKAGEEAHTIYVVVDKDFAAWRDAAPRMTAAWLRARDFRGRAGTSCLLPGEEGMAGVLVMVASQPSIWDFAGLPHFLPAGTYRLQPDLDAELTTVAGLGWALGSYRYDLLKKKKRNEPRLLEWPETADRRRILAIAEGTFLARDLVNAPASDMGPDELARAALDVANKHKAKSCVLVGEQLLESDYPMIHAVGRASSRAPRLIDFVWGKSKHPRVTLVGKGVCFDSGGLDIKPAQYMKLMKKDMGGAACILGLAHAIMSLNLPVRLRVLIPAVENSVAGNAMRPLDVLRSRKGLTVEVGDTDAEGRLCLADALAEAMTEEPELIIDAATLTGAARVALGTGMPAIFCNRSDTWQAIERSSEETEDPLWRLPLHEPYRRQIDSKVADLSSTGSEGTGGAITAALFLREFVDKSCDWVHMDTMGYNLHSKPGRPTGGEAMGLRALLSLVEQRFASPEPADVVP